MRNWISDNEVIMRRIIKAFPLLALLLAIFSCNDPVTPEPPEEKFDNMQGIIINEVMPSKSIGKEGWIEIYNKSDRTINLKGLQVILTSNLVIEEKVATLNDGTIGPQGRFVISTDKVEFSSPMLRNTLQEVAVADGDGSTLNSFSLKYDYPYTVKPEDGESYARIPDITGEWTHTETPTPGEPNYKIVPHRLNNIVINEVCPDGKWVELANTGTSDQFMEYAYLETGGKKLCVIGVDVMLLHGEKLVLECPDALEADFNAFSFYDNTGRKVAEFSSKNLSLPASGGSWSRLPDVTGDFKVSSKATKGAANESLTDDPTGIVINEVSLAGWVEIANSTLENIVVNGLTLSAGGKQVYDSGSVTIPAGGHIVATVDVKSNDSFSLSTAAGVTLDTFEKSDVRKDAREANDHTSWSRLPDGTGKWFTVLTPSRGELNYGIEEGNTIAIWVRQSSTNSVDLEDLCKHGIGNIVLHEWAFKNYGTDKVNSLLQQAHSLGMRLHIWLQCFWWNDDAQWRLPVIDRVGDTPARYNQELFDEVIDRAKGYMDKAPLDGIHFDYIRFGGTAAKHSFPEDGITGTGAVTEFCRQANVALKAKNPDVVLSAALMGETNAQSYYGQDPGQMTQFIDVLMPMAYISSYNYSSTANVNVANWFADRCKPGTQSWHGISTYNSNTQGLSEAELYRDCVNITNSRAHGIALFREGLGTLPNLTGMFAK